MADASLAGEVSASAPAVEASLHAVAESLPLVLAQPSANDDMDVIVGVPIDAACNLTAAFQAEGSVAEDAVGLAAKSPYQADTSVRLALLQAGASDGNQSQVSSVMT